jgi:hypothetical protein
VPELDVVVSPSELQAMIGKRSDAPSAAQRWRWG